MARTASQCFIPRPLTRLERLCCPKSRQPELKSKPRSLGACKCEEDVSQASWAGSLYPIVVVRKLRFFQMTAKGYAEDGLAKARRTISFAISQVQSRLLAKISISKTNAGLDEGPRTPRRAGVQYRFATGFNNLNSSSCTQYGQSRDLSFSFLAGQFLSCPNTRQ